MVPPTGFEATVTTLTTVAVSPALSVTVRRTEKVPAPLATAVAVGPLVALVNPVTMPPPLAISHR